MTTQNSTRATKLLDLDDDVEIITRHLFGPEMAAQAAADLRNIQYEFPKAHGGEVDIDVDRLKIGDCDRVD